MSEITVAATQMACTWDRGENVSTAIALVEEAAERGAQIILLQELFETPYFCIEQNAAHLGLASSRQESELLREMAEVAKRLEVVIPISWYEQEGQCYFNSIAIIDADGSMLGVYRKSHIPNVVGYQEKSYFTPGDTGFKVWQTRYAKIGVAVCWDQWFPEAARCMALLGAEILFYPTAIGSEPGDAGLDSRDHWRRVMQGHAAANVVPVVVSNRIGREVATTDSSLDMTFYGNSFICDYTGEIQQRADDHSETVLVQSFDLERVRQYRHEWGLFRDRRPDLYGDLLHHTPGLNS
ncbi:MAG: N-carbamoylputrescine amidase [Halioglobus sp.]|jgi:N-carbamoylputrescine amidase